jgi:hypothetical protein
VFEWGENIDFYNLLYYQLFIFRCVKLQSIIELKLRRCFNLGGK